MKVRWVVLFATVAYVVSSLSFAGRADANGVDYGEVIVGGESKAPPPPPPPAQPQAVYYQQQQPPPLEPMDLSWPPDRYDDSQSNIFRVTAYLLHPVGFLAEWIVFRPFHRLVAQQDLEPIFGHTTHEGFDYESYVEGLSTGVTYEVPYSTLKQQTPP